MCVLRRRSFRSHVSYSGRTYAIRFDSQTVDAVRFFDTRKKYRTVQKVELLVFSGCMGIRKIKDPLLCVKNGGEAAAVTRYPPSTHTRTHTSQL